MEEPVAKLLPAGAGTGAGAGVGAVAGTGAVVVAVAAAVAGRPAAANSTGSLLTVPAAAPGEHFVWEPGMALAV